MKKYKIIFIWFFNKQKNQHKAIKNMGKRIGIRYGEYLTDGRWKTAPLGRWTNKGGNWKTRDQRADDPG